MKIKAVIKGNDSERKRLGAMLPLDTFYEFTFGMMPIPSVCCVKANECCKQSCLQN